jgi:heme A synthase
VFKPNNITVFRRKEAVQLGGIFALGGLQGALGWYMVQSGLDEHLLQDGVPRFCLACFFVCLFVLFCFVLFCFVLFCFVLRLFRVSQYRLAAHMGSAVFIYGGLLWHALNYLHPHPHFYPSAFSAIPMLQSVRPLAYAR